MILNSMKQDQSLATILIISVLTLLVKKILMKMKEKTILNYHSHVYIMVHDIPRIGPTQHGTAYRSELDTN